MAFRRMSDPAPREEVVFTAVLKLAAWERAAYLTEACGGDDQLRARVEALLRAVEQPAGPARTLEGSMPLREKPGDKIGRYKLLQQIGEGGCGVVYMADQEEPVKRRVALKVIKPGMDTKEVLGRFEAERQALALMEHPNICKVLDAGATETGRPFFVMELVRGMPITCYCDETRMNTEQRLELFIQVCQAIQHAHQKGIIHRDIKPSNVLVADHDGVPVPRVIDFGIAKATTGQALTDRTVFTALEQFIGTPAYMSPEQANLSGLDVDTRSDIYSLGVLLYELLTGKPPFDARRFFDAGFDEIRRIIHDEEPQRPSRKLSTLAAEEQTTAAQSRQTDSPRLIHLVRGDLDWIVMKCLEKDRNRRYETANSLASDLERHINNEPVLARPPSTVYRFQKMIRRHKLAFAAGAAVATAVLVGLAVSTYLFIQERRAHDRALAAEKEQSELRKEAEADSKKAKSEAERAEAAVALANQRLTDSEAISQFLIKVFQSPDPARDGRTITVAEILGAAVKKLESDLARQPERRAKLQATLGATYHSLGLDGEAIPLQEKVRDYCLATSGLENPDTLMAIHNLAISYYGAGRRDEALQLREQVLELRRKVLGPENPETLRTMNSLANSYDNAGRREEALKLREQVLALRRKVSGPENPETLMAMNNLAVSYNKAGRRDEALKMREQVLALRRKVLGPEHPDTIMAMNNLANSFFLAGRREEALNLREQVLALHRKVSGPEHPDTIMAMNNMATSYLDAGRRDQALQLREQVLRLSRKVNGPEHPDTLKAMGNLANCYDKAGRRDEALKLREEVLALSRKVMGPEHADTLLAMSGMADSYDETGRRDEAFKLREQVLALRNKSLGPEHPETLDAMAKLATSCNEAGRRDQALKLREQVLTLSRKVNGPEHPDSLDAMAKLATSYYEAGRQDEALKLQEAVLAARRKAAEQGNLNDMNAVAWQLATSADSRIRDGAGAVHFAEKAVAATNRKDPIALDSLAASYAAASQFDKAVAAEKEALALVGDGEMKKDFASRLDLFQTNTPYRETPAPASP
jgi:serine/threonine protein kinase/multisubunit Na+/H+ antiporter MnhF subunit